METQLKDLTDLRALCLVADTGSITAAAKLLGEGKGSVSRRLTRLERTLGLSLLLRSPRRVQATEEGAAFRAQIGRAIELIDAAAAEAEQAQRAPRGHLRVTAPYDLGITLFAPIVARFVERHPEVSLELILTETLLDFDSHHIDIALRAAVALQDSTLVAQRLADLGGGIFAAPSYLKKHGTPRTLADLARHRMVVNKSMRGTATLALVGPDGAEVRMRVDAVVGASDFAFCKAVAVAGGGIAPLPSAIVARELAERSLTRVLEGYGLVDAGLYLIHSGARPMTPKVRAFRDFVAEACLRERAMHGANGRRTRGETKARTRRARDKRPDNARSSSSHEREQ